MEKQLDSLNQWIRRNKCEYEGKVLLPLMECTDGVVIALGVGKDRKSNPRRNIGESEQFDYTQVEIPFISKNGECLRDSFFDDFEIGRSGMYSYVPVSIVENYVNQHGGYVE